MVVDITHFAGILMQTLSLRDLYFQWESAGVFEFFLPALLIFAVVFGILSATKILGDNRGISIIISLAIAILAIRTPFVSEFFTMVFPGLGIGIAILVVALILGGLFIQKGNIHIFSNVFTWGGIVIGLIIVIAAFNNFDWFGSIWWQDNWTTILWIVLLVAGIAPFLMPKESFEEKQKRRGEYVLPWGPIRTDKSD